MTKESTSVPFVALAIDVNHQAGEGYLQFNELYQATEQDSSTQAAFEEELMVAFCGEFDGSQELSEDEEDEIYPANKLTSKRPAIAASSAMTRALLRETGHGSHREDSDHGNDIPKAAYITK